MRGRWLVALGLAGCGVSSDSYLQKRVELECEYAMDCYDDATKQFLGYTSTEDCVQKRGDQLSGQVALCKVYDKNAAKDCLKALRDLECPADGESAAYPEVCDSVWLQCSSGDSGDTAAP